MNATLRRSRLLVVLAVLALVLAACGSDDNGGSSTGDTTGGGNLSGEISVDGSSTVAPLTGAAVESFNEDNPDVQIAVGTSGTGGGFKKFCAGETDMSDASRPIKEDDEAEAPACKKNGIKYEEIQIANDGIALVVNKENDWAKCLTVEQLNKIWGPDSQDKVDNWNQVDSKFPDQKLSLFGPGTASGTFDFFTDQINGEEGSSRSDYNASEDDNVTVQGVEGDKGGLGYFGLSYFEQNKDRLKALEIDGGGGCVAPNVENAQTGTYKPLSRPLFIYAKKESFARPEVHAFIQYILDNEQAIAEASQFVPLTDEQLAKAKSDLEAATAG